MNDQSQIEAKIIHLTPPQRFQVAHQLPKERPAVPNPVRPTTKGEEYKVITTNPSKIWAIRILNGTWHLVTLFLKRCTRIDKNLLVVYVALVLLLLQVFMVISRAEASAVGAKYNLIPLIAAGGPSPFPLMEKDQKIKGFPKVPWPRDPARLLSARAEGCFHLVPGEGECLGLQPKALSAHRPASDSKPHWHCRKARRIYESGCRTVTSVSVLGDLYERADMIARGGQRQPLITSPFNLNADRQHTRIAPTLKPSCNRQFTSCAQAIDRTPFTLAKNPPWQLRLAETCPGTNIKAAGAAAAFWSFSAAGKGLGPCGYEHSIYNVFRQRSGYPPLSGSGVPQMITSTGS